MRKLMLVGRLGRSGRFLSRRCAWCNRFYAVRDRVLAALGAKITHGVCEACAHRLLGVE